MSSGALVTGGSLHANFGGFGQVSYNVRDRFHLTSRWEYTPGPFNKPFGWYLGAGFGSKTALIVGGTVGALLGLAALTFSG